MRRPYTHAIFFLTSQNTRTGGAGNATRMYTVLYSTVDTPRTHSRQRTHRCPASPPPASSHGALTQDPMFNPCAHRCRPSLVPTYYAAGLPCAVVTILRVELLLEPRLYTEHKVRRRQT